MKMIIAIIQNDDEKALLNKLMKSGYRATKLATTGGFLRTGNTTVMIGIDDDKINDVFGIIHDTCRSRMVTLPTYLHNMETDLGTTYPVETRVGGATVFVLPVEQKVSF